MTRDDALADLKAAALLAARRGSLVFHLDLATELARVALERRALPTGMLAPLSGSDGYEVRALEDEVSVRALASVRFDAAGVAIVTSGAPPVDWRTEAVGRARQTLTRAYPDRAPVVIPRTQPGVLDGYALTVASQPGPLTPGDHLRLTLSPDGRSIVAREAASPGRLRGAGWFASDEAVPNELHVYLSLKHGQRLSVDTIASGLRWHVDGEHVAIA